jgi:peptidoglycan-associated lipoprotein
VKKYIWSLLTVVLLSACASGVKLNDVPVEDKSGSQVNNPAGNNKDGAKSSSGSSNSSGASSSNSSSSNPNNVSATSLSDAKSATPAVTASNSAASDSTSLAGPLNAVKVIYFDYDSYSVKPEFQSVIEAHAQFLKSNQRAKVSLEGHTDERGSREYNLALGQKRADAVRQSLTLLGVSAAQIESVSFGEEKPAVSGSDEAAYAKNRRAEFFYK